MDRRNSEPVVEQNFVLQNPDHACEMLLKLNALRSDGSFTDAVLCVGQEEFPCHRNVLAVSSPYFQAMFSSDLRESKAGKVSFNDVSPWTMRRVIEYAYTGRVEITVDNAQEMLAAGHIFQYGAIVEACCVFLRKHLHPSNCLGIENFAHLYNCSELEYEAHRFTLENFSSVVEYDEFLELPLQRLLSYLASDLIDVRSEEIAYSAAMNWIRHGVEERASMIPEVLEQVRLATVDMLYLETVVETDPLISVNEDSRMLVENAKRNHVTLTHCHGQRRRSIQENIIQPRPSTVAKEVMVLVGGINNYILTSVEMYEPHKDKWNYLPELPASVSWHSTCAFHNDIYVSGGISDGHIVSTVWRFDSSKRKWSTVSPMLTARARHSSTAGDDALYVMGGVRLHEDGRLVPVESIECHNADTGQWSVVGESPFPRKHSKVVPYCGTLVEVGGTQGDAKLQTLETYLCKDGFVKHTGEQFVLPEPIQYSQIVVLDGILYIIWEETRQMIALDPKRRTFRRLPDTKYVHLNSGATVLNGKIYTAGGTVDTKASRIIECYDPASNTWSTVKSMRHPRSHHGCVTIRMS